MWLWCGSHATSSRCSVGPVTERDVRGDRAHLRPAEVDTFPGDSTKARESLGWQPTTSFPELVRITIEADLKNEGLDPQQVGPGSIKKPTTSGPPS